MTEPRNPTSIPAVLAQRRQSERQADLRAAMEGVEFEIRNEPAPDAGE